MYMKKIMNLFGETEQIRVYERLVSVETTVMEGVSYWMCHMEVIDNHPELKGLLSLVKGQRHTVVIKKNFYNDFQRLDGLANVHEGEVVSVYYEPELLPSFINAGTYDPRSIHRVPANLRGHIA